MKEVLLRIACASPKMCVRKRSQAGGLDRAFRKIEFSQPAQDPDVHGKRLVKSQSKQEDAIRNLAANTGQEHQLRACLFERRVG